MQVDLTLAVNYLPACACLCKTILLMTLIGLIQPGDEIRGGYVPLAAVLYLDRVVTRNLIFDANAILLAVFFSNVHASIRASSQRPSYWFFLWGLHAFWIAGCLILIYEPQHMRWVFEKRIQASRIVPIALMLMVLTGTSYVHGPLEPAPFRACRAMAFTLLSFAWIYIVGIHSAHGLEYLKETSSQFVVRLAPVLYSPPWLAGAFLVAAVVGLVLQYSRQFQRMEAEETGSHQKATGPPELAQSEEPVEDLQLHELLRQAKLSSRHHHHHQHSFSMLDTVIEEKA